MDVQLIDFTGKGQVSPADYAARLLTYVKNTRLEQGKETQDLIFNQWPWSKIEEELAYIANTIRSSWEMVDYTFQITGVTRAFTHQFVRTRVGVSFAQQAQRVVDMHDFQVTMPETVADNPRARTVWNRIMATIKEGYADLAALEIPNQDSRGVLPTNVHTNIIAKMNLRTLADLVGKRENLRAQGEYADVVRAMKALAFEVHPWLGPFLTPERTSTPQLDKILAEALGTAGPLDKPHINEALKELDKLKGVWG